jgi:predicted ATPase/transcriptional regulator with XRE-family HTH domain
MGTHRTYRERRYAFGEQLLTLRSRVSLTQIALAAAIGVHRRSLQNWESGESYPQAAALQRLIAALFRCGAFAPAREREEALTLWELARQDGPRALPAFDDPWFARMVATQAVESLATTTPTGQQAASADARITCDGGEVPAVPTVYGREHELFGGDVGALLSIAIQQPTTDDRMLTISPESLRFQARQPASGKRELMRGLPFQPTSFIGRDDELSTIARLLADPRCRLLTLLGPGGIGKTRLALAAAQIQTIMFADGVTVVELASVGTANQMVSAIGDALQLSFADQPDAIAGLLSYLRERQLLLVLDNFEHLLVGADLVAALLAHAPQLTLLITSRERLNLQAEWLFDVDGLAYPPPDSSDFVAPHDLAHMTDYSAVELFVQRAVQIQPGLALTDTNLAMIARICHHVAGMPLAIELAAAAVRLLSLAEIEQQIRTNLDVLATTRRDMAARHRSIRAVFEHSWHLLSEPERACFARLAVFRGGWTTDAAAQVAQVTLAQLTTLVDKSLVRQNTDATPLRGERAGPAAAARFMMLEPIREYALGQLRTRGEITTLQYAHARYYLTLAEASAAQWDSAAADRALAQLDREQDNLRAALQWACDGGYRTLGLQLAGALRKFWRRRGSISEGRGWLEELLALEDTPSEPDHLNARLRALEGAAWLASDQHDYLRATQLFEQSMALHQVLGATEGETNLLVNAGIQARAAGQYQQATALLEDAVAQHRRMGDRRSLSSAGLGLSLFLLGLVLREQGKLARATALFTECVELHRAIADREGIGAGLLALSDIARDQGELAALRSYGEASLTILRQLGVQWAIGFALNNLALGAYQEGQLEPALALMRESVALFRAQQADASLAEVLITLGQILHAQGDGAGAYRALNEALQIAQALGPRLLVAAALEVLADLMIAHGEAQPAAQLLAAAAALRTQMGTPVRRIDQARLAQTLAIAQSALGADVFAAVWLEAQTLPIDLILSSKPFSLLAQTIG